MTKLKMSKDEFNKFVLDECLFSVGGIEAIQKARAIKDETERSKAGAALGLEMIKMFGKIMEKYAKTKNSNLKE